MFYVSRKVGRKYAVVDTEDNIEEFYFASELRSFVDNGIYIKGADYIRNVFTVTPVIIVNSIKDAAKNRLITGSGTGYKGFDLSIDTSSGDVVAQRLTDEFKEYMLRNRSNNGFILTVPDIVTVIGENFLSDFALEFKDSRFKISVILPKSLKRIKKCGLSWFGISDITFNGVLDCIARGDSIKCTLLVPYKSDDCVTIPARILNERSLTVSDLEMLCLPYTESIDDYAIVRNDMSKTLIIKLGNEISHLKNIVEPFIVHKIGKFSPYNVKYPSLSKQVMSNAVVIDIPDDNKIYSIRMSEKPGNVWDDCEYRSAYILIMSEGAYYNFSKIYSSIKQSVAVGVITYKTEDAHRWLLDNIDYCCHHNRSCFKNSFTAESFGKINRLYLK